MGETELTRGFVAKRVEAAIVEQTGGWLEHRIATGGGRYKVRWDENGSASTLGQRVFFSEFLEVSGLFERRKQNCPLTYSSPNAPDILGVKRVLSDESLRRALKHLAQWLGLPPEKCPRLVRGDNAFGNEPVTRELEDIDPPYLFKLRQTSGVKRLLERHWSGRDWQNVDQDVQAVGTELMRASWIRVRRVVVLRRGRLDLQLVALVRAPRASPNTARSDPLWPVASLCYRAPDTACRSITVVADFDPCSRRSDQIPGSQYLQGLGHHPGNCTIVDQARTMAGTRPLYRHENHRDSPENAYKNRRLLSTSISRNCCVAEGIGQSPTVSARPCR